MNSIISDHAIFSSNPIERHTDECHGLSSVREYDAIGKWGRESARDFYSPVHLKKILFGKESQPWVVSGGTLPNRRCNFSLLRAMPGHLDPYNAVVESE